MIKNVYTADGIKPGIMRSKLGFGESIVNFNKGTAALVKDGMFGKDTVPSDVSSEDDNVVLGNDINLKTGNRFSEDAMPYTLTVEKINNIQKKIDFRPKLMQLSSLWKQTVKTNHQLAENGKNAAMNELKNLADGLKKQHVMENYRIRPGIEYADSGIDIPFIARALPNMIGLGAAGLNYARWNKAPGSVDVTRVNPYETSVRNELAKLRYNPNPEIKAATDAERIGAYQINNQGSLRSALRAANRVAAAIGNAANRAKIYANSELQNNKLAENRAAYDIKLGDSDAIRAQDAAKYNRNDFVASHGKMMKGVGQSIADFVGQAGNWYKNEFAYKTWKDTRDLYESLLTDEQKRFMSMLNQNGWNYRYDTRVPAAPAPRWDWRSYTNLLRQQYPTNYVEQASINPEVVLTPYRWPNQRPVLWNNYYK